MTSTDKIDVAARMALLHEVAHTLKPRLFALYGVPNRPDAPEILGWGMDFDDGENAVLYLPDASVTHHTVSADHVARRYSTIGEIRVAWLDDDQ